MLSTLETLGIGVFEYGYKKAEVELLSTSALRAITYSVKFYMA